MRRENYTEMCETKNIAIYIIFVFEYQQYKLAYVNPKVTKHDSTVNIRANLYNQLEIDLYR